MIECTLYRADGSYKTTLEVPDLQHVVLNMEDGDHVEPGLLPRLTRYEGGQIVAIQPAREDLLYDLRLIRDRKLRASDWTELPSARLSEEKRAEWRAYRQALFDLPETTEDPGSPVWPIPPL